MASVFPYLSPGYTFKRADEIQWSRGIEAGDEGYVDNFLPIVADAEAGFGGVLNAYELMKNMVAAGAAGGPRTPYRS